MTDQTNAAHQNAKVKDEAKVKLDAHYPEQVNNGIAERSQKARKIDRKQAQRARNARFKSMIYSIIFISIMCLVTVLLAISVGLAASHLLDLLAFGSLAIAAGVWLGNRKLFALPIPMMSMDVTLFKASIFGLVILSIGMMAGYIPLYFFSIPIPVLLPAVLGVIVVTGLLNFAFTRSLFFAKNGNESLAPSSHKGRIIALIGMVAVGGVFWALSTFNLPFLLNPFPSWITYFFSFLNPFSYFTGGTISTLIGLAFINILPFAAFSIAGKFLDRPAGHAKDDIGNAFDKLREQAPEEDFELGGTLPKNTVRQYDLEKDIHLQQEHKSTASHTESEENSTSNSNNSNTNNNNNDNDGDADTPSDDTGRASPSATPT